VAGNLAGVDTGQLGGDDTALAPAVLAQKKEGAEAGAAAAAAPDVAPSALPPPLVPREAAPQNTAQNAMPAWGALNAEDIIPEVRLERLRTAQNGLARFRTV
jgi:hypothetical protein